MKTKTAACLALCLASAAAAQDVPRFESLSIRRLDRVAGGRSAFDPQRLVLPVVTLADLATMAYGIERYQLRIDGQPSWVTETNFSLQATTSSPMSRPQMLDLLRAALADRFQLVVDRKTGIMDTFSLTVASGGPKFGPLAPDAPARVPQGAQVLCTDIPCLVKMLNGMVSPDGLPRPVLDATGLKGNYDIRLTFGEADAGKGGFTLSPDEVATHLPGDLKNQLGLQLTPGKAPVEVVRIVHAAMPAQP